MKIHYDKDITKSYHVTELHCTNTIELDGVTLIPITELEKINAEIDALYGVYNSYFKERLVIKTDVMQILDKHIKELGFEANLPIHCKDCEFYMPEKEHRCFLLPKIHPTEDWFCGFAKRKENK